MAGLAIIRCRGTGGGALRWPAIGEAEVACRNYQSNKSQQTIKLNGDSPFIGQNAARCTT
jgi:hypothetical protein